MVAVEGRQHTVAGKIPKIKSGIGNLSHGSLERSWEYPKGINQILPWKLGRLADFEV